MAILYGSAVSGTGGGPRQSTRSYAHARSRATLSTYDGTPTTSDQLIIAMCNSDNLLENIQFWGDGGATAGAFNLGLYEVTEANQGITLTVIDADLFASAQSVTAAVTYTNNISVFAEAGTLDDVMDRGKTLWALAAIGAASYTEDPGKKFAIVATPSTTFDAATEIAFKVSYVAGD